MDEDVRILVSVPVCSFRKGYAREYLQTEEMPPPSTVYGFLLSLIGEEDRYKFSGTNIAYSIINPAEKSVIIRTVWRTKIKNLPPGTGSNRSPDYQEILTGLKLVVWIQEGPLAEKIGLAGKNPSAIDRFGGLCLGESRDLVNDVIWWPDLTRENGTWLTPDAEGDLPLPVWVDHVGSKDTVWRQFRLVEQPLCDLLPADDPRWIEITNTRV